MRVPTKRRTAKPKPDAPITGVATGSLGTAANLDDTQVMRTADLQAAASGWLDDDSAVAADDHEAPVPLEAAVPPQAAPPRPRPKPAAKPSRPRRATVAAGPSLWRNRSGPRLAAVAAFVVLLLFAGSGFLSQLDLGVGAGSEATPQNAVVDAAPTSRPAPTPAPKEPRHGKCHGRGHNCQGNED